MCKLIVAIFSGGLKLCSVKYTANVEINYQANQLASYAGKVASIDAPIDTTMSLHLPPSRCLWYF